VKKYKKTIKVKGKVYTYYWRRHHKKWKIHHPKERGRETRLKLQSKKKEIANEKGY